MIVDAQGNFCGTGGCTFMAATMRMKIGPKKPNPRHISAFSRAKDLKWKDFDVVISVPKGRQEFAIPYDVNSLQLSCKSRKNRGRSAASLYQFVRLVASEAVGMHKAASSELFEGPESALKLTRVLDDTMRRVAGAFYPKISEYRKSLSEEEDLKLCDLTRDSYTPRVKDIDEGELQSHLEFPPNSKEAKEGDSKEDMAVQYSELQAADQREGASHAEVSDAEVSDAEVFDAENAPEKPKKVRKKPRKVSAYAEASGLEEEEKPLKPKKLWNKKKPKNDDTSDDVMTEKFATSQDLLES